MSIPNYKFQGTKEGLLIKTDLDHLNDSFLHQGFEEEEDDEEEELIRVVLRRKYSSGLSCFHGVRADHHQKQKLELDGKVRKTFSMRAEQENSPSVVERAVRRAFSMRASSASANEVYRRIDYHYDPVPVGDEETNKTIMVQTEIEADHKKRNNKILEACRRFFGF